MQDRALTPAEAMHLTKTVTKRYMNGLKRVPWYWPATLLKCGGLGLVIGYTLYVGSWFRFRMPEIFWYAIGAVACFLVGSCLFYRVYLRYFAQANGASMPAGSRHILDERGYTAWRGEQQFFLPWKSILSIEGSGGLTLIATSPAHYWPIVPAASDTPAAAQFIAELQRRWQQAKAARA